MSIIENIKKNAKAKNASIVLPEGTEERTVQAAGIINKEGIAKVILLGKEDEVKNVAQKNNVDLTNIEIICPEENAKFEEYANTLFELRKHKGITLDDAKKMAQDPLYFGVLMVNNGDATGMVAGAQSPTSNVLRPALQILKTEKGISSVSGAFIVMVPNSEYGEQGVTIFADCAVTPVPTAEQMAENAFLSARTAKTLAGFEAKVAMLSFSTKGSAKHELVDKVANATAIAKEKYPELMIDGELQADAALVPEIGKSKSPDSNVAGQANVLIFPDLQAGNIGYKLVERFAKGEAIGPILQGIAKPVNDLSRGCSIQDIVNTVAITALQA